MRLRDALGRRPTLAELTGAGFQVRAIAREFGSWWDLLGRMAELDEHESRVLAARRDELIALERDPVRLAAPWHVLDTWLELGGVHLPVDEVSLAATLSGDADPATDLLNAWPEALGRRGGAIGLRRRPDEADVLVLEAMIAEVVAARMNEARRARTVAGLRTGVPLKVMRSGERPILKFTRTPDVPARGPVDVDVEGERFIFQFVEMYVNVAHARPGGPNVLGALLRGLFGPDAGRPGTDHRAVLRQVEGRWTLIPSLAQGAAAGPIPYYADLAVACGLGDEQHADADRTRQIRIRSEHSLDPRRHFVVRARGDSMDGGPRPIRDGDLVLCARLDSPASELVAGKPCLLVVDHGPDASEALIKVPVPINEHTWVLRSWSKDQVDRPVARLDALRVVARVIGVVQAEPDAQG